MKTDGQHLEFHHIHIFHPPFIPSFFHIAAVYPVWVVQLSVINHYDYNTAFS